VLNTLKPPQIVSYTSSNANGNSQEFCQIGTTSSSPPAPVYQSTCYSQSRGTYLFDPILAVVVHPAPFRYDAESQFHYYAPWRWKFWSSLGPMGALSMESPTDNFYYGGSLDMFARNLQIVGGGSVIMETVVGGPKLICTATTGLCPANGTYATEVKQVSKGGFFGVTFNLTGFLSSLGL
jgi:hypothetical protein